MHARGGAGGGECGCEWGCECEQKGVPPLPPADAAERSKSSIREKGGGCGRQFSQIHQIAYRAAVNQGLCLYAKELSGER